jgi:hypothetical protein
MISRTDSKKILASLHDPLRKEILKVARRRARYSWQGLCFHTIYALSLFIAIAAPRDEFSQPIRWIVLILGSLIVSIGFEMVTQRHVATCIAERKLTLISRQSLALVDDICAHCRSVIPQGQFYCPHCQQIRQGVD